MPVIGLKLKGEFKFDLYDADKKLIRSSNFVDNFITNTGVIYPYYYAFADCFRFMSIGTGTGINSIISTGVGPNAATTGLQYPLTGYAYLGSNNYSSNGCGWTETLSGINLFREWSFPDATGGLFTSNQTFNEFMVTPGQPYNTGIDTNLNPYTLCTCDEKSSDNRFAGNDCSPTAMYYNYLQGIYHPTFRPTMCDAIYAFARVVYPFSVVTNSSLRITYRLAVVPDTGVHLVTMNNTQLGVGADPNWSGILNSVSHITQPGIVLINDGTVTSSRAPEGSRLQHFNYTGSNGYSFQYGESFVPPMGCPLEPSTVSVGNNQNIVYYLSSDNKEFVVGPSGNLVDPTDYAPWNPSNGSISKYINIQSGLAPFANNNRIILSEGATYWSNNGNAFNIRTSPNSGSYPQTGDVTQISTHAVQYYTASIVSQPTTGFPLTHTYSGNRTGTLTYNFDFQGYADIFLPVRSFVASYTDIFDGVQHDGGDDLSMVPFFDCIFSGSGQTFLPAVITGANPNGTPYANGSYTTGAWISGTNDIQYFYLLNGNGEKYPIFFTTLSWSVPCPQGVTGC